MTITTINEAKTVSDVFEFLKSNDEVSWVDTIYSDLSGFDSGAVAISVERLIAKFDDFQSALSVITDAIRNHGVNLTDNANPSCAMGYARYERDVFEEQMIILAQNILLKLCMREIRKYLNEEFLVRA